MMMVLVLAGCAADGALEMSPVCSGRLLYASCDGATLCAAASPDCGYEGQDCCADSGERVSGVGALCAAGMSCNEQRRCARCR